MGSRDTGRGDQSTADDTPEDVAVLYSWANLQGAKYRDYSASRREYRAQVRYRAARVSLERELKAQLDAEAAAAAAERAAAAARAAANSQGESGYEVIEIWPVGGAEEPARLAAADRVEAARRAESAARAAVVALREEREVAAAHSSAERQAQIYEESELRRRQRAGPQPHRLLVDRYGAPGVQGDLRVDGPGNLQQFLFSGWQDAAAEDRLLRIDSDSALGDQRQMDSRAGDVEHTAPAWLFSSQALLRPHKGQAISPALRRELAEGDTLQDSRERVAARWFALKDVFDHAERELPAMYAQRPPDQGSPLLVLFSLAGGVGKTSLVATLGRALANVGHKVVVADTTSQGLLTVYFGSGESGAAQSGLRPEPIARPPLSLVIHNLAERGQDDRHRQIQAEAILKDFQGSDRLLIDLPTGSSWLIRQLMHLRPTVLVPMLPDMNSVISLHATERLFRGIVDADGRSLTPVYVLNQFDASLPLHLDVREVLRRQLGERLLRFAIRRSQAVSEALAEGMTVLDYAPEAAVSQDYRDIATWLRGVSLSATEELHNGRGSEW